MLKLSPLPSPDRVAEPSETLDSQGMSARRSITRATDVVLGELPATVSVDDPLGVVVAGVVAAAGSVEDDVVVGVTATGATIDDV
jgi:hypothetical protein